MPVGTFYGLELHLYPVDVLLTVIVLHGILHDFYEPTHVIVANCLTIFQLHIFQFA